MVYGIINVCVSPERHREGVQQLKSLARWLTKKYGAETTLLSSRSDAENCKQLVTRYRSPAQMREIDRRLIQDTEFTDRFHRLEALVRWDCTPGQIYHVVDL